MMFVGRVPETHAIVSQLGVLTSYLPVCRRGIESSCNVAGNGPTHVRRTTVPAFAGIGLLHPHCKYCDSRIQIQTRFPLFCDCGTGCKQVENVRNATHLSSPTNALTHALMHSPTSPTSPTSLMITHSELCANCV